MEFQFSKKSTKYVVNGQEYDSLDQVPEQFRQLFQDRDGDGRPDALQGYLTEVRFADGVTTYRVGDREYRSPEEMPPEHRALFESHGMPAPRVTMAMGGVHGWLLKKALKLFGPSGVVIESPDAAHDEGPSSPPDHREDLEFGRGDKTGGMLLLLLFLVFVLAVALIALVVIYVV